MCQEKGVLSLVDDASAFRYATNTLVHSGLLTVRSGPDAHGIWKPSECYLRPRSALTKDACAFFVNAHMAVKAILAKKVGMTRVFQDDGTVVPVTVLQSGPCTVTFVRPLGEARSTGSERGKTNVQLGFEETKEKHLSKPQRGHLKDLSLLRTLREFRLPDGAEVPKRGDTITVSAFSVGDRVRVSGVSKGRGFAGVVKRHGFAGGPASHGTKHTLRAPGSIGTRFPQHVVKGRRMAGRMGGERVTVPGLTVVDVVPEEHLLVVKGAVPGHRGTLLEVRAES
ncbi:MAG: large subunit ribosomal protein L3 [Parcubacteria group bacterium Gr01-1014_38]|nr:MAG: large subunit ribosomal protein L3 [Parcubacteria group bacterium Gr01-1014_38]